MTMASVRIKRYCLSSLILFSSIVVLLIYLRATTTPFRHRQPNTIVPEMTYNVFGGTINPTRSLTNTNLNVILPGSALGGNESFECVTAQVDGDRFPICVYESKDDDYISGRLRRRNYYRHHEVHRFLRLLRLNQDMQMVDLGANIGVLSLPAARLTKVVSVEPNMRSMSRLAKSVELGSVSSNVTLVHNAVSDNRTTFYIGSDPTNQGNSFLTQTANCTVALNTNNPCRIISRTNTIVLNDLLPLMRYKRALMKVDVQGFEDKVFTETSAGQFFGSIEVPVVFLEWCLVKLHPIHDVHRILHFFETRNYSVFTTGNKKLSAANYKKWPLNVLFKKMSQTGYYDF